jgi:hypothetical protein
MGFLVNWLAKKAVEKYTKYNEEWWKDVQASAEAFNAKVAANREIEETNWKKLGEDLAESPGVQGFATALQEAAADTLKKNSPRD